MPVLACNACNADFPDEAAQKSHYRSDWHQYNLRRKVAGVPGVSEALFNLRLQALAEEKKKQESSPAMLYKCSICDKEYRSMKAHAQHVQSRLHLQKAANESNTSVQQLSVRPAPNRLVQAEHNEKAVPSQTDHGKGQSATEEDESDEWEEIGDDGDDVMSYESPDESAENRGYRNVLLEDETMGVWNASQCFFCDAIPDGSIEGCVEHMHKQHGFFIPDSEFLKDPRGMLNYLGLKVTRGFVCLYCDERGKQFQSLEAVRKHMISKSHCKLRYEYGGVDEELEDFYDFSSSYMLQEDSQIVAVDDAPSPLALSGSSELVIRHDIGDEQSTKILGSREFARYYKQRPRPSDTRDGVLVNSLVARYRSMGLATREPHDKVYTVKETKRLPQIRAEVMRTKLGMKNNVIRNLPKNVPY